MEKNGKTVASQWDGSPVWQKSLGLAGMGILVGALLFGSWNNPVTTFAHEKDAQQQLKTTNPPNFHNGGFADIAKQVTPAVVNITVSKQAAVPMSGLPFDPMKEFFGAPGAPGFPPRHDQGPMPDLQGAGSGVIVSSDGYVLTNNHVVEDAKEISVTLPDKREYSGTVVGLDPQTDLAVIKVEAKDLPFVRWGDSSSLQVGEYVLAVGNPFGLNSTVTLGIVSALGRGGMGITQYEDFIQTDAAINPGNSGGALVNTQGELVGINTAIFSRSGGYQGVGFAVPTKLAKPIYTSLVKSGTVVRGFLGVGIQAVTPELAKSFQLDKVEGALVTNVMPGSPADQAGIQRGDVIVEYEGQVVEDPRALQGQVVGTVVGNTISMAVMRDGKKVTLRPMIREQNEPTKVAQANPMRHDGPFAGVAVQDLDGRMAQQLGIAEEVSGVVVMEVTPGSYAERAGLAQGDVISEINRKPVRSEKDFVQVISHLEKQQDALLFIHRGKGALYLTVKI
ncbi:MAG: DegQ family serine endoprotease [Nitrospirota bacterium]|nr:DegQ family serine endoprotease [Nitrospirota bacterium]MDH5773601.1 DegQ family serine endoprotease [Nitrospirota bacterium]